MVQQSRLNFFLQTAPQKPLGKLSQHSEQLGRPDFCALIGRSDGYPSCEKSFLLLKPLIPETHEVKRAALVSNQIRSNMTGTVQTGQSLFVMKQSAHIVSDSYRKSNLNEKPP